MNPYLSLPLDRVLDHPDNPRSDLGDLTELAESIRNVGVLQPVTVRREVGGWRLIAGHRRTAAARLAGLTEIPAIVRGASEDEVLVLALTENLHRLNISAIDEAEAYNKLKDQGWPVPRIAAAVNRSETLIYQKLRLLTLPDEVQEQVRSGELAWYDAYQQTVSKRRPPRPARGEPRAVPAYNIKSGSLVDFAAELRRQADDDVYPARAALYRKAADHFESAASALKKASEIRVSVCRGCGEDLATHPIGKDCTGRWSA